MLKTFLKFFLFLDNFCYKAISCLAVRSEKGVHPKHRLTKYHQFFLNNISSDDKVLDVGCGHGLLAFEIAQKAKEVFAIDILKSNIEKAKKNYNLANLHFILGDALEYNFESKFDVIVLSNVLEHIKESKPFLFKMGKLSEKLLIRVPFLERDWLVLYKKEMQVEHRLDKGHFIEYTMEDFKKELKQVGLSLEEHLIRFGEIWALVKKL